jgi:RimJ/RimL family protein N-acetyltransferase
MKIEFRPLTADDLPLLHEWLQREHVRRWWKEHKSYEEVVEHYLPAIEGREPTYLYAIVLGERLIGFIQMYTAEDGIAGVDLFIAESELLGLGLGTEALRTFVDDVVFADARVFACIADPDAENVASLRTFQKAGFAEVSVFVDPSDGRTHTLVRRNR